MTNTARLTARSYWGCTGKFERLEGMVEGYRRELEVTTGEMRRMMGDVKRIQAYLDDKARDVAKAAEEVAGSLETVREIEGRLLSLADELKMLPGRTAVCARAAVLSVLALASGIERGAKTALAGGAGALVYLAGLGWLSVPVSFLTRLGCDRFKIGATAIRYLDSRRAAVQRLGTRYRPETG